MEQTRNFLTVCVALLVLAACSGGNNKETNTEATGWSANSPEEESAAIAGLQVYQRDLETLENLYQNIDSKAVRAKIISLREQELIRIARNAHSKKQNAAVKAALRTYDSEKAHQMLAAL